MSSPQNESITPSTTRPRWLSIIGIGEDGIAGLSKHARHLVETASLVVGGKRHLALADKLITGERLSWPSPITGALDTISGHNGKPVVVLATGDPFHYGVGTMLAGHFPADEILCLPQPSAFSLAAARLGWSHQDITLTTLHGRPLESLNRHLHPGARILALSWDATTPRKVAALLCKRGLDHTQLTVLEALGGPNERRRTTTAENFDIPNINPLNTLAIKLSRRPADGNAESTAWLARLAPGFDDCAFDHDGQLTKRDIRAITMSALSPRPGELLWDVGLGAGSIAIEWLLCHPSLRAVGFERDAIRAARARNNALALGTPDLDIVTGPAPDVLKGQPTPDAVFIGGGLSSPGVFEAAWNALRPGGRLIANAVTLESHAHLAGLHAQHGGNLIKIDIAHAAPVGRMRGWRAAMPVVQWRATRGDQP